MKPYEKPSLQECLAHHGIKGMKWGVRRFQNEDGSLTKAGKERYNSVNIIDTEDSKKKGLSDKQKTIIKVGAAAVATALVAYGTYKLADSGELHRLAEKGKMLLGVSDGSFKKNEAYSRKMSADQIAETFFGKINPGYGERLGSSNNCRRCTFAYELSRRGYDVKATQTLSGTGQDIRSFHQSIGKGKLSLRQILKTSIDSFLDTQREGRPNWEISDQVYENLLLRTTGTQVINLRGSSGELTITKNAKRIFEALSKMPEGARGEFTCTWLGGKAHSRAWEIIDGKPIIFDMQTSKVYKNCEDMKDAMQMATASITRLDNLNLDFDFLRRWVTND